MENNLVLYRRYRPLTFAEVIGQDHIIKPITFSIAKQRFPHAYLFSGMRGVGKTTIARLIAKAINCEKRKKGYEPCNQCPSCLAINQGNVLDLLELDAASHRGIDEARSLIETVKYPPSRLKYKVFIIDEVHMLTREAFNALLKTLEEPPSYAIFILATTEPYKVPPTIISRCQRFDFQRLSGEEIETKLKKILTKEGIKMDRASIKFIAGTSEGSLRDAESLLEQVISQEKKEIRWQDLEKLLGIVPPQMLEDFIENLLKGKQKKALELIAEAVRRGKDIEQFTIQIVDYLRKMVLAKTARELLKVHHLEEEEIKKIASRAKEVSERSLLKLIEVFSQAKSDINRYPITQMALEIAVIETGLILK